MSPVIFHSIWTVALLILFIGIIIWAFSSRRKKRFDAAARMPLEEEPPRFRSVAGHVAMPLPKLSCET